MTDYITLPTVKKRSFSLPTTLPDVSQVSMTRINNDDVYIARNGDTYIARNGDTYVAHNITLNVYPRILGVVKKRSFVLNAKVTHG